MVRRRPPDGRERPGEADTAGADRGQILLAGAVAIALIILGFVVVFNTVLFTDSIATSSESIESASEARDLTQQVYRDVELLVKGVRQATYENRPASTGCASGIANPTMAFKQNFSAYSEGLSKAYAKSGPVYADVTLRSVTDICKSMSSSPRPTIELTVTYETPQLYYEREITVVVNG